MKRLLIVILPVAAILALVLHNRPSSSSPRGEGLTIYCAAGLKKPVEAATEQYRAEQGEKVHLQFGGTGTLLSQIRVAKKGDLFVAADEGALADARKLGIIQEVIPVALQHPVIAVSAGNPKKIHELADLYQQGIRLALANPEAASVGRATKTALGSNYTAFATRATVTKPTVTEIASDLKLGSVDAAIIWDSTVRQFPGLEAIEIPELSNHVETTSIAVLTSSTQSVAALRFARYLAAPEKGGEVFKKNGFSTVKGDQWSVRPELILYSGGVNRPAIEKLLHEFSDREGINLTTVFNGCGILCASMKAMASTANPKFPDAYYACDLCFVPPVAQHFPEAVVLTETAIGLAVQKGNPHNIHTLADLAKPGLRVGLCNAEQSTLGFMTRGMLRSKGLVDAVRTNIAVEVPTADFLVNQMRAGALDAAIVYQVNAAPQEKFIEFLPIDHPGAKAVQPFSVRGDTPNRQLAGRLLVFLQSNRARFETAGFHWRGEAPIASASIEIPSWLRSDSTVESPQ